MQAWGNNYIKISFTVYLKFKFNWASVFLFAKYGNPVWVKERLEMSLVYITIVFIFVSYVEC